MILVVSVIVISVVSVVFAIASVEHELSVPKEIASLKIEKKKNISGVILFLKKKIVHYSSKSS